MKPAWVALCLSATAFFVLPPAQAHGLTWRGSPPAYVSMTSAGRAAAKIGAPTNSLPAQAPGDLYVYPARGQNRRQLDADREECHRRAVERAGYDPNHASTGFQVGQKRLDYDRAISTCLESRGYTVK